MKVYICPVCGKIIPPEIKVCYWCYSEIIPLPTPQYDENSFKKIVEHNVRA